MEIEEYILTYYPQIHGTQFCKITKHVVFIEDNNYLTFTLNLMHLSIFLGYLGITLTPDAHSSTEY